MVTETEMALLGGSPEQVNAFLHPDQCLIVDWKATEEEVLSDFGRFLEGFTFSTGKAGEGEWLIQAEWQGRTTSFSLAEQAGNAFNVLIPLSEFLAPTHEMHLFRATMGTDTLGLLIRPVEWWAEVRANHGPAYATIFGEQADLAGIVEGEEPASPSEIESLRSQILGALLPLLPPGFGPGNEGTHEFTRKAAGRTESIGLWLNTHYWPHCNLQLTFGVSHDAWEQPMRVLLGEEKVPRPHIWQSTGNIHAMKGLLYLPRLINKLPIAWRFMDLGCWRFNRDPAPALARVPGVIRSVIRPFFRRFASPSAVWESLRKRDGWIWQRSPEEILAIGAIVGDWAGVEQLAAQKAASYREPHRQQLLALIGEFKTKLRQ